MDYWYEEQHCRAMEREMLHEHVKKAALPPPGVRGFTMLLNNGDTSSKAKALYVKRDEQSMTASYEVWQSGQRIEEGRVLAGGEVALTTWSTSSNTNYLLSCSQWNQTFTVRAGTPALKIVPDEAKYKDCAKRPRTCTHCGHGIPEGTPLWYTSDPARHWCPTHKQHGPSATAGGKDHNSEDDMLRQNFTFPYTGQEIADALERKAVAQEAQIKSDVALDDATLELLGYSSEASRKALREEKQSRQESVNKNLQANADQLRKEAAPYAKAAKQEYDLDLDDVEHFGLNDTDAPAPKKVRRQRAAKPAEEKTEAE